jgi:hypothetical protein
MAARKAGAEGLLDLCRLVCRRHDQQHRGEEVRCVLRVTPVVPDMLPTLTPCSQLCSAMNRFPYPTTVGMMQLLVINFVLPFFLPVKVSGSASRSFSPRRTFMPTLYFSLKSSRYTPWFPPLVQVPVLRRADWTGWVLPLAFLKVAPNTPGCHNPCAPVLGPSCWAVVHSPAPYVCGPHSFPPPCPCLRSS